ncbi:hypothetical protein B9Z51_15480 [Limnohabitans sp. T6-5]|uniref:DUF3047 domain-containing protein n=1 Tax=Limnohabitans sp. T6-5 TaxID=1100724 RepID=UPI000D35C6D6|nr:DUF3047 domain-containing protein [Limnohabitans sp. T6-5]PUE06224.1 hypothetical protein B9Z51_15480 [Limnohabitans sp. T6-5]
MSLRCLGLRLAGCAFILWGLSGCATTDAPVSPAAALPHPVHGALVFKPEDSAHWEPVLLPGKLRTAFKLEKHDRRPALRAHAQSSASMLRQRLNLAPDQLGRLQFQWQVENLMDGADMAVREAEDSPVRLILAFDGDRSRFSAKNAMLSELTQALTGEPLPYATLMYVWCNQRPAESVIINPRSDRIRKLVVESGASRLKQWLLYERDIRADFEKAFGEPPGALVNLAIMTDSDNTRTNVRAWYGDIRLDGPRPIITTQNP